MGVLPTPQFKVEGQDADGAGEGRESDPSASSGSAQRFVDLRRRELAHGGFLAEVLVAHVRFNRMRYTAAIRAEARRRIHCTMVSTILWYQLSAQGWQTTIHPEDLPKLLERWRSLGTSE